MSLFLTKYNLEVGGKYTDGEVRVYRQYISVLTQGQSGNTFNESISDTLNLVQTVNADHIRNLYDTLNLTDDAYTPTIHHCADTLNLSDSFTSVWVHNISVTDNLSFTDTYQRSVPASANNTLSFVDEETAFNYVMDRKVAYNTLNFQQTVLTLSSIERNDTLNFQQTVNVYNSSKPVSVFDHIFFHEDRLPQFHHMWVEDSLALTDRVRIPLIYSITQTLGISDSGSITSLLDELSFVQTVQYGFGVSASNTLNLTQNLFVQALFNRLVVDDLGIGHTFTWYELSSCAKKQYTPFQGEDTTGGPTAPPDELPIVQVSPMTDRMLLYYPATGPATYYITLRAPEMDNRDRNAYTRITRETRGGKLIVYADPVWPKVRTMVVTIIGLKTTQATDYQTFVRNTLGKEIGITDWEGRMWAGVIINPEEPVTQDGRESWTITFSCECELLDGQFPHSGALGITDSVSYTIV